MADDALHKRQESLWELLFQSVPDGRAGSEHRSMDQVTDALVGLGLHPAEVDRIEKAVLEAMKKAWQREEQDQTTPPPLVRLWCSGLSSAHTIARLDIWRGDRQEDQGWGFFLLEREEDASPDTEADSHRVIEVYLYQERRPAR